MIQTANLLARRLCVLIVIMLLNGCLGSGEDAAKAWMANQQTASGPTVQPMALPEVVDTAPVTYNVKGAADPFSPKALLASRHDKELSTHGTATLRFPDTALESIRVVALLRKQGRRIGLVSDGVRYENLRVGDFVGREQAEVVLITDQEILVRQADGKELQMTFNQRSS